MSPLARHRSGLGFDIGSAPRTTAMTVAPVLAAFTPELHSYDALITEPFPPGSERVEEVSA